MNNQTTRKEVFVNFLKRYGYIVVLSIIMISLAVILAVTSGKGKDNGSKPVDGGKIEFYNPVLNATVHKDYSDTKLFWNETLKQYEAHKAVDLKVADGSDVFAVLDGTVEDVYTNMLEGTCVVLSHADGLKTFYSSLEKDSITVKKGDTVSKGAKLGKAGNTAKAESSAGAHLHFAVEKNGNKVDPNSYLNLSSKS